MDTSFFRAMWRWHFYAGLIVLPVLAWMAGTGALYLYKPEIERALHRDWIQLSAPTQSMPLAAMIDLVERQAGAKVTQITRPAAPDESWRMRLGEGERARMAYVRPDTGQLLGLGQQGGPMESIKRLHSLSVAGPFGNILVEIVAGWAILLVLTGFYLWWPRGANRALSLAGKIGERRFWRNLHASAGALTGGVLLFLAITGMPWTYFWGARFHAFVAEQGIGRPRPPGGQGEAHDGHLSWSMQGMAQPMAGHPHTGLDDVLAVAEENELRAPWVLDLPSAPGKPYRIASAATRAQDARILFVDPADGRVLQDVNARDFGIGARAFDWGIYTHQGQQYGEVNRLVMLAGCLGTLLLAATAPVLWWKRRRGGTLSAPPPVADPAKMKGVAAMMLALGAFFPLTGLTMIAALAGEWLMRRIRRPLSM